jgi:hypothetical protein
MHNTKECRRYNSDGTRKKMVNNPKSDKPSRNKDGMNFSQIIPAETRKAVCTAFKKSNHSNKRRRHHRDSNCNSDSDYWSVGLDSTGDLHVVKNLNLVQG